MSVDPVSISAIIIAVIGALGVFINRTHLSRIICCKCIESDCRNNNDDNNNNNNIIVTPRIERKILTEV
jgi:hypothetical protein